MQTSSGRKHEGRIRALKTTVLGPDEQNRGSKTIMHRDTLADAIKNPQNSCILDAHYIFHEETMRGTQYHHGQSHVEQVPPEPKNTKSSNLQPVQYGRHELPLIPNTTRPDGHPQSPQTTSME